MEAKTPVRGGEAHSRGQAHSVLNLTLLFCSSTTDGSSYRTDVAKVITNNTLQNKHRGKKQKG